MTSAVRVRPCSARWALIAGIAALAADAVASHCFGAENAEMVVSCTNLVSGTQWQIRINFEQRTVDSTPARISSSEISWHATDGGHYTLDRKTGDLTVVFPSSTGGYFIHDRCRLRN